MHALLFGCASSIWLFMTGRLHANFHMLPYHAYGRILLPLIMRPPRYCSLCHSLGSSSVLHHSCPISITLLGHRQICFTKPRLCPLESATGQIARLTHLNFPEIVAIRERQDVCFEVHTPGTNQNLTRYQGSKRSTRWKEKARACRGCSRRGAGQVCIGLRFRKGSVRGRIRVQKGRNHRTETRPGPRSGPARQRE